MTDVLAAELNGDCHSAMVDRGALDQALRGRGEDFFRHVTVYCPHLFAAVPFFISGAQMARMRAVIAAVEGVVKLPAWKSLVIPAQAGIQSVEKSSAQRSHVENTSLINPLDSRLRGNDGSNDVQYSAKGVFFGYDFHLNAEGAHLIEINSNAGGAFLNALLLESQRDAAMPGEAAAPDKLEQIFVEMFRNEWRLERGDAPLQTIVIVDEQPQGQYLYPEFLLAQQLFGRAGIAAIIADPAGLDARNDGLYCQGRKADLVYNRLTDFALERHAALRAACQNGQSVLTPHPRAYALYADKRNLVALTDAGFLRGLGVAENSVLTLQEGIPETRRVQAQDAGQWWSQRKQWFFKPAGGFGSKGTYRGDKLTKRVFGEILQGGYVAQKLAAPGERMLCMEDGEPVALKADVRCYVYNAEVQLVAARLYQGQATNFRTPGGGFAQVRIVG